MATTITAGNATNGAAISSDNTGILELKTGTGSGTTAMTVNSSQNVGVGTTSPSQRLHIQDGAVGGTIQIGTTSVDNGTSQILLYGNVNQINFGHRNISLTGAQIKGIPNNQGVDSSFYMSFFTTTAVGSTAERMRIDPNGNVGIGTTSPTNPLQVNGNIVTTDGTTVNRMTRSGGVGLFGTTSNHPIVFQTNDTERVRLSTNGNLGIGTTDNDVNSNNGSGVTTKISTNSGCGYAATNINTGVGAYSVYQLGNNNTVNRAGLALTGSGWTTSGMVRQDGVYMYTTGAGGITINAESAQPIYFGTSNTERARIDSSGRFMIGATSSDFTFRVNGDSHFGDVYDPSKYGFVQITRPSNQGTIWHLSFIRAGQQVAGIGFANNSSTFVVANSGNNAGAGMTLGVGGTSWGTQSDERKKNILGYVEDGLNKVATLRSVFFEYKNDELKKRRVGLIAQDVQAVLPEAIDVQDDEDQTLNLQYSDLIPLLIKSIQELKAELDATKAEVAALKGAAQ